VGSSPGSDGPADEASSPREFLSLERNPDLTPVRLDRESSVNRATPRATFEAGTAPLAVEADGAPLLFEVQAIPVLPGATVRFRVPEGGPTADVRLEFAQGSAAETDGGWDWVAPAQPGAYALEISAGAESDTRVVQVTALVAHPASLVEGEAIHGFRLGRYMDKPLRGDPAYLPPDGFIEVPAGLENLAVSPHFVLGQFLCKQEGDRRFLVLSPALLAKLEAGLQKVNEAGHRAETFHVMSGYRTPAYNRAIGNTTVYSRHLYGDAADIYVDIDGNGHMDDLNGDGTVDSRDARVLFRIMGSLEEEGHEHVTPGGLGLYGPKPHRGPFVHVDTRGTPARW
jgi:hypothetical protein